MNLDPIRQKRRAVAGLPSPEMRRALREAAGLVQTDIADAVGVHRETVSRWERGERTPRGEALIAYVELLDALRTGAA